jgi:glycosyltransferase involved in cell wall biosynthesis
VMEAALCGTPSIALAIGGLPESIVDGTTGLLAHDTAGLIAHTRRLLADRDLREGMGEAAERRAGGFTWDRSARAYLEVMRRQAGLAPGPPDQIFNGAAQADQASLSGTESA